MDVAEQHAAMRLKRNRQMIRMAKVCEHFYLSSPQLRPSNNEQLTPQAVVNWNLAGVLRAWHLRSVRSGSEAARLKQANLSLPPDRPTHIRVSPLIV